MDHTYHGYYCFCVLFTVSVEAEEILERERKTYRRSLNSKNWKSENIVEHLVPR